MRELTAKEAVFCKATPEPVAALRPWRTGLQASLIVTSSDVHLTFIRKFCVPTSVLFLRMAFVESAVPLYWVQNHGTTNCCEATSSQCCLNQLLCCGFVYSFFFLLSHFLYILFFNKLLLEIRHMYREVYDLWEPWIFQAEPTRAKLSLRSTHTALVSWDLPQVPSQPLPPPQPKKSIIGSTVMNIFSYLLSLQRCFIVFPFTLVSLIDSLFSHVVTQLYQLQLMKWQFFSLALQCFLVVN